MKAHALFGEMSDLVDRLDATRAATAEKMKANAGDKALQQLDGKLEAVKKKIVATKEGGAITGEERIREHADHLYGALLSYEGKPSSYLIERTQVLKRELDDVHKEFDGLSSQIHALNLHPVVIPQVCIPGCEPAREIETK